MGVNTQTRCPGINLPSHNMNTYASSTRYLERILTARVYDVAVETALDPAPKLSRRIGNSVLLKREDMQPVFSFKLRGAYNKMSRLSDEQRARGVVTASAGNHAQGVALAAHRLGCSAVIVMPRTTPDIKIAAVRALGGEVLLHGDTYDEAQAHALQLCREQGRVFVHPYDDPDVIAGQGTIAVEILRQYRQPIDAIFVAVGGGGLISGIAAYVKHLLPEVKIIGVEPVDAASMQQSLACGRRVTLKEVGLFADGVAVKRVGRETFRLCRKFVDEMVLVNTDQICAAIKDVFEDTRSILEPAGALGVAGVKEYVQRTGAKGRTFVAIACGANMNFDRLRHVSERSELGEQREAILAVTIPERPGSFKAFCRDLGAINITEFNYRYADPRQAHVFVGIQVSGPEKTARVIERLRGKGYEVADLTGDEFAKLHLRHLVGGRGPEGMEETFTRFEFPERPGALMRFLDHIPATWSLTLFHYRNHGADTGRVAVGMNIPGGDQPKFRTFLKTLGYRWVDESANQGLRRFLSATGSG